MLDILEGIEAAVMAMGPSLWLVVAVLVLCCVDGFFSPVPSESIVIAAAVLAVSGEFSAGYVAMLVLAAAVGAFWGDVIAYWIGSRVPVDRIAVLRGPRGRAAVSHTRRALAKRGSTIILTGRFIPVGRVAVNMTAGAVGFGMSRFAPLAAIASSVRALYSGLLGLAAGHFLDDSPLVAMGVGVLAGVLTGVLIDRLMRQRRYVSPSSPTMDPVPCPGTGSLGR